MTLLAPALLLGLLGLAAPVIAHLLGREPPQPIRFAAMRFLHATERSSTQRRAIQDWPLLIVRLLLLALLVVVLTRPSSTEQTGVAVVGEPHDAVVLVDASRSMELRVDGRSLLEHAIDQVDGLLASLPPGSRVGLLTTDPDGPREEPSADPDVVRDALERWKTDGHPRAGAWTMAEALPGATALLQRVEGERPRVVYAVGDATARGLGSLPKAAEGGALVVPVPAIDAEQPRPEHVAIEQAHWEPAPELDPRAMRIQAALRRHPASSLDDAAPERRVPVVLRVGDTELARTEVVLPFGELVPVEFTHTLSSEQDLAPAVIALDVPDDPMPSDDTRHLWLAADDAIEVVVVNGDPSELRAHDEVWFLSTAVGVGDDEQRLRLRSLAPDQLESRVREQGRQAFRDVDVLVLANLRAPSPDVAPTIVEQVHRGMGLWITVGDRVQADAYNARLGELLPLRMREAVRVGTAPGRTEARAEGMAPADLAHPAFRGLRGDLGLTGTRARRVMLLEPDPQREHQIALSFTSGAPALLTREVGVGRVALLTTSIDRDWADLPLRPGFVPMISSMLGYLASADGGGGTGQLVAGEVRHFRTEQAITITTPTGQQLSLAPDDEGQAVLEDTYVPGHYRVDIGDTQSVLSVAVDPVESDTQWQALDPTPLQDGERRHVAVAVPRWRGLWWLIGLLLAAEAVLRLRSRWGGQPARRG
ncbi:BatA domain-containing protein [Paraliomyxa miuraensis]|uniref:BatA domain-containing protein n=1 Tax=Paraliomyxa miuraensis TaxID=376150 RepID=UPI0022522197|nr:BatA domain-containing protein [Paraliomyxa miuraensis]MCX4247356.1 BatA domain-containing protein [Paraliomyxa miuraensis]